MELLPECPFCQHATRVERKGDDWLCDTCGHLWFATTRDDVRFMKVNRIAVSPGDPEV